MNVAIPIWSSLTPSQADRLIPAWKHEAKTYKASRPAWEWAYLDFISGISGLVMLPYWTLATHLSSEDFIARTDRGPAPIRSASLNHGPRRVIFVVEDGEHMPPPAEQIEAEVISEIVSKARAEDSFGLLSVNNDRMVVHLGASRDAVMSAAHQLEYPIHGRLHGRPNPEPDVLKRVLEATTWFDPPQPGDSIFLFATRLEPERAIGISKVRTALTSRRIRLFGFQLGRFEVNIDTVGPWEANREISYRDRIFVLSRGSGGVAMRQDTTDRGSKLTDERLAQIKAGAGEMYRAITEYYVLQVDSIGSRLTISLAPRTAKRLPVAMVLYPWFLPACTSSSLDSRPGMATSGGRKP